MSRKTKNAKAKTTLNPKLELVISKISTPSKINVNNNIVVKHTA